MNGYSEPGRIYFEIGNKTAYAKYPDGFSENRLLSIGNYEDLIETGTFCGSPPYKRITEKLSEIHKQYHSAEHKVYNCFMNKIKKLNHKSTKEQLKAKIPCLEEAKGSPSFSPFCGTTILFFSGIALILSAIPNLTSYHNKDLFFMGIWLTASILIAKEITKLIQEKFFLATAKDHQIVLAIKALKEALHE